MKLGSQFPCEDCGTPIVRNSNRHRYCNACATRRHNQSSTRVAVGTDKEWRPTQEDLREIAELRRALKLDEPEAPPNFSSMNEAYNAYLRGEFE